jgi:hypothetical protein
MKIDIMRQTKQATASDLLDLGAIRVKASLAPTQDDDLVNKAYADSLAAGLDPKGSVRVATTANVDLATGGLLVIDGITVADGDRVLVKDQTDPLENGIYVAAAGAWVRAEDQDGSPASEVSAGNFTFVEEGSSNATAGYVLSGSGLISLGSDALNWVQFSKAGEIVAGFGLDKTGNTLSVDVSDFAGAGLEDDGSGNLRIASGLAGNGLNGGGGAPLSIEADTTGGANLARAIAVSLNGVAVKIDDLTIGENGGGELEVKNGGIAAAKLDTSNAVGAGVDGFVLAWNQTAGKMEWTAVDSLASKSAFTVEQLIYGGSNDIVAGTPYGLSQEVEDASDVLVFWEGLILAQTEYTLNISGNPDTVTLNDTSDNEFSDGDRILIAYLRKN